MITKRQIDNGILLVYFFVKYRRYSLKKLFVRFKKHLWFKNIMYTVSLVVKLVENEQQQLSINDFKKDNKM